MSNNLNNSYYGEPYELCPFDQSHKVRSSKFMIHVQKCDKMRVEARKALGKERDFFRCPYDASHMIPVKLFETHRKNCPAKDNHLTYLMNEFNEDEKPQDSENNKFGYDLKIFYPSYDNIPYTLDYELIEGPQKVKNDHEQYKSIDVYLRKLYPDF